MSLIVSCYLHNSTVMITGSPLLRELDVSEKDIGDDGISFCLQHTNTLNEINFSVKGITT